jgi:hypothetical protein
MTATVIKMSIQRMVCTGCGAEANASCNCGKAYVPKAVRAAQAMAANPEKSDRAIAADIGVSPMTVRRAREAGASYDAPSTVTGRDGKQYPAIRAVVTTDAEDQEIEADVSPKNYQTAFLLRAESACTFAIYSGRRKGDDAERSDLASRSRRPFRQLIAWTKVKRS